MAAANNLATLEPSKREEVAMGQLTERLHRRFPALPTDRIDSTVQVYYHQFDGSPIRDFVPIFVERNAIADLSHLVAV
jgi:hypothetical protein